MANSQNFETALNSGKLPIRAMWYNPNAPKNKITIQFSGRTKRSEIDPEFFSGSTAKAGNSLIRIASGISTDGDFNYTVLASWKLEELQNRMNITENFLDLLLKSSKGNPLNFTGSDSVMTATELYGTDVTAAVERCTVPNTRTLTPQQPVQAPDSSIVMQFENKPIYQHTWLIEGNTPAFIWSGHTTVNPSLQEQPKAAVKGAPVVQELVSVEDLM